MSEFCYYHPGESSGGKKRGRDIIEREERESRRQRREGGKEGESEKGCGKDENKKRRVRSREGRRREK